MTDKTYLEYPERFHSFIVFEPASLRVHDNDILMIGEDVPIFFNDLMEKVLSRKQTIKEQILHNRLVKIGHMLDLLTRYDQVLITQYFDKIWRRYSYISHLGENFLNLETLYAFFPEYKKKKKVIATRFHEEESEVKIDGNDDSTDNDSDETSNSDRDNDVDIDSVKDSVESEA